MGKAGCLKIIKKEDNISGSRTLFFSISGLWCQGVEFQTAMKKKPEMVPSASTAGALHVKTAILFKLLLFSIPRGLFRAKATFRGGDQIEGSNSKGLGPRDKIYLLK